MATQVIADKSKLVAVANAIRTKGGTQASLTLDDMVDAIDAIETGGSGSVEYTEYVATSACTKGNQAFSLLNGAKLGTAIVLLVSSAPAYNQILGGICISDTFPSGSMLRYRNGTIAGISNSTSYDALISVGDVFKVIPLAQFWSANVASTLRASDGFDYAEAGKILMGVEEE